MDRRGRHGNHRRGRKVAYIAIACEVCAAIREYSPGAIRQRPRIRFCSWRCMGEANRKPDRFVDRLCGHCKQPIKVRHDHIGRAHNHFCSIKCRNDSRKVDGARWRDRLAIKMYMKQYGAINRLRLNAKALERCRNTPEETKARKRRWRERHPDRVTAISQARRARVSSGDFTASDWAELKAFYKYTCLCCQRGEPEIKLTPDHVIPLVLGGSHSKDNIQPLCKSCNSRKHTKTTDYRRTT